MVAVSSHDSSPWTDAAFNAAFGERYRTLQVGDELSVSAAGVARRSPRTVTAPSA